MSRLIGIALLALAVVTACTGVRAEGTASDTQPIPKMPYAIRIGVGADGVMVVEPATPEPTRDAPVYGAGVEDIIRAYDWQDDYAIAVAWCESKFDPSAYNRSSGASGIFQILPYWHASRLRPGESWFDAETNVRIAYELWREQGWTPWSVGGCP